MGIAGASTTGTLALTAAAYFPALTLTIAMTASDFVWQGFAQGDRDGCKEWPIPGESLFSYQGKPLPTCPSTISFAWVGIVSSWSQTWLRFFGCRGRPCGFGWRTITCCKNFRMPFSKMRTEKGRCYGKTKSQDPSLPGLCHGAYCGCSDGSGPVPVPPVRHAGGEYADLIAKCHKCSAQIGITVSHCPGVSAAARPICSAVRIGR